MLLIVLLVALVSSDTLPDDCVVWVEHYGSYRETFVNNQKVPVPPHRVLSRYVRRGYRITHHAMAATETHYTSIYTHYSWMLEKKEA